MCRHRRPGLDLELFDPALADNGCAFIRLGLEKIHVAAHPPGEGGRPGDPNARDQMIGSGLTPRPFQYPFDLLCQGSPVVNLARVNFNPLELSDAREALLDLN
ncbi:hypothetical protein [Pseudaminobacter soli (ex Zhang et al. 2022)]|uniref:hypothetical protein n=1 Tax=Pseudaminobacter soli (ex Zhang et al. 2022) TaxID=2831468 RepID=UPI00308091EF